MAKKARTNPVSAQEGNTYTQGGEDTLKQLQNFWTRNQKKVIGVGVAILVVVGGFIGYTQFIQQPKEQKAYDALFAAERWLEIDSFNLVLNGNAQYSGALNVIKKFDGTKAANLAKYYAGVSYLQTGDFQNAVKYLEGFNGKSTMFEYQAYGLLGDAHMELKNADKAIQFYKKAVGKENTYLGPIYLFRTGLAYEQTGNLDEAKKCYLELKNKYPYSTQARDIDKYLGRVGAVGIN